MNEEIILVASWQLDVIAATVIISGKDEYCNW